MRERFCAIVACGLVVAGCNAEDPPVWEDGPAFLIVGEAAHQGVVQSGEKRLYVQARGGDYVGIVTHGGMHALGALPTPAATSCAALKGSDPLYVVIDAQDPDCVVEVRLYNVCDGASVHGDVVPLDICETEGTFVTSTNVHVHGPSLHDGGTDG